MDGWIDYGQPMSTARQLVCMDGLMVTMDVLL